MAYDEQIPVNKETAKVGWLVTEKRVENGTGVMNGRLVERGTDDYNVVVGTNENMSAVGWVGRDHGSATYTHDHDDRTTAYDTGDLVAVYYGGGELVAHISTAITFGQFLVPAALGSLKLATNATAHLIVAQCRWTLSATGFAKIRPLI